MHGHVLTVLWHTLGTPALCVGGDTRSWSSTDTSRSMWQMRHFSLVAFLGSIPQAQIFAELEPYFVDPVVIGEDKYCLGYPSSSLVFLLCSLSAYYFLFTSSIVIFLSHVSFEDLLQSSGGWALFGSEPSPLSPLSPSEICNKLVLILVYSGTAPKLCH